MLSFLAHYPTTCIYSFWVRVCPRTGDALAFHPNRAQVTHLCFQPDSGRAITLLGEVAHWVPSAVFGFGPAHLVASIQSYMRDRAHYHEKVISHVPPACTLPPPRAPGAVCFG